LTKWKAGVFAAALAMAAVAPRQARAQSRLSSAGVALCLQPSGGMFAWNGSQVHQVVCNPNDLSMYWYSQDGGVLNSTGYICPMNYACQAQYYRIRNVGTGLCLDDTDGSSTNRTVMQVWQCNSSTTERWSRSQGPTYGSATLLINLRTGKCLDAVTSYPSPGTAVVIYSCAPNLSGTTTVNLAQFWYWF
jgi:Ricin-type beta-trefoil lectin domain-like